MGFKNVDSSINKEVLENNYDAVLENNNNKILIFNRLRQDTEFYFRKKNFNQREYIDENVPYATNPKSMFNHNAPFIDRQNQNTQGNDTQNSSTSPSIFGKILNKIGLLKKFLFLYFVLIFEISLENICRDDILMPSILKEIRRKITPSRLTVGFIIYIILSKTLGIFYFILKAFAIAFMILIYRS